MATSEALLELARVLWAWLAGEGPIGEMILAWLELATGRYLVGDQMQSEPVTVHRTP